MRERTVTISGLSKTFSCTGWRLGYAIAPPAATTAIRKVHDFLTVGAPAPLQAAGAVGLAFDADYYNHLAPTTARGASCCAARSSRRVHARGARGRVLRARRLRAHSSDDDRTFAEWLAARAGVATVPASSFYRGGEGPRMVRFAFCKRSETLERAAERLVGLRSVV
jgi:aminotransferase